MTERKPPGLSFESWIDRQVRVGREHGAFDDLPGAGRPLDLPDAHDEMWWVKDKLRREGVEYLPPSLVLRRELDDLRRSIPDLPDEDAVRAVVADLNARAARANAVAQDGPPVSYFGIDPDDALERWRHARAHPGSADEGPGARPRGENEHPAAGPPALDRRRRGLRALLSRRRGRAGATPPG